MDRLDLELYADRLERHAARLQDELEAARLRMTWCSLERAIRDELTGHEAAMLEAVGVMAPGMPADDERMMERRRTQLAALSRVQEIVERRIDEHR